VLRAVACLTGLRMPTDGVLPCAGEGVAAEVLAQVRELVSSGCRASQELDRRGGIRVLEVMGRDVDKLGGHSCATVRIALRATHQTLLYSPLSITAASYAGGRPPSICLFVGHFVELVGDSKRCTRA